MGSAFLGNTSSNMKRWIETHRPETLFCMSDGTREYYDIRGCVDDGWLLENGFKDGQSWTKDIKRVVIGLNSSGIGGFAFSNCQSLEDFYASDNAVEFGNGALSGCVRLSSAVLPEETKTISESLFSGCTGLTWFKIPGKTEIIGKTSFQGCSNLENVSIPDSVKSIQNGAFRDCNENLYDIQTLPGVKLVDGWACEIVYQDFQHGALDLTDVRGICEMAFYGCDKIEHAEIPGKIHEIPHQSFASCPQISSVLMHDGVQKIGNYAFMGCGNLIEVNLPDSVLEIGMGAFQGCSKLSSIHLGNGLTSIGKNSFNGCSELLYDVQTIQNIIIVDGWVIGYENGFPSQLDLSRARGIANEVFSNCANLQQITLPESMSKIGDGEFMFCQSLESVSIPTTVNEIGHESFAMCDSLESITIPENVETIGNRAFYGCTGMTSIEIQNEDVVISDNSFRGCFSVVIVDIPNGIRQIGQCAFQFDADGQEIMFTNQDMQTIREWFDNGYFGMGWGPVTINCYDGSLYCVYGSDGWDVVEKQVPTQTTFYPNNGESQSYDIIGELAAGYNGYTTKNIYKVEIGSGVTKVANRAFERNTSVNTLSSVVIYGVPTIGNFSFKCPSIKNVLMTEGVKNIGKQAFRETAIEQITIPRSVVKIEDSAFIFCYDLKNVNILGDELEIEQGAFWGCNKMEMVSIPNGNITIGGSAFEFDKEEEDPPVYFKNQNKQTIIDWIELGYFGDWGNMTVQCTDGKLSCVYSYSDNQWHITPIQ